MYEKEKSDGWMLDKPKLLISLFCSKSIDELSMPKSIDIEGLIKASIEGKL